MTDPHSASTSPTDAPVTTPNTGSAHDDLLHPEPGKALCLSGGGYRAMLFHLGAIWRLYEAGQLKDMKRISSVSGGSITAGVLGLMWSKLSFDPAAVRDDFVPLVVKPIRDLARRTIDAQSIIGGMLLPGTIAEKVTKEYDEELFGGATLQDLPDDKADEGSPGYGPRFVLNATNVQSGVLWRFSRPYMGDYRVGLIRSPRVKLATAVAASSAFPPVLSPLQLKVDEEDVSQVEGNDLHRDPYTRRVFLTDGGVYDNLGLETVWKRYETVLVSDGGGAMSPEPEPKEDWARHAYRVLNLIDSQVRSLRKRALIDSYKRRAQDPASPIGRKGAYWGIRTDIKGYGLADPMDCSFERTRKIARTPTRLKRLRNRRQKQIINWGYAICDAAIRTHIDPGEPKGKFPYDDSDALP